MIKSLSADIVQANKQNTAHQLACQIEFASTLSKIAGATLATNHADQHLQCQCKQHNSKLKN